MKKRQVSDTLGTISVPESAYYGAQTQRAVENFPVSGLTLPMTFIQAVALIKKCAAQANRDLGHLDTGIADAVVSAASEIIAGRHDHQFVVDVFQTGSGTSTNMNVNEVVATRANELLTGKKQVKSPVHPNDHVNLCQSSNDVIPTATHIAAAVMLNERLLPALERLETSLEFKAQEFHTILKIGRTHLQDAVPMRLGDEFSGYARQIALARGRVAGLQKTLTPVALGGTAVGTGLNAHPGFAETTIRNIALSTGIAFYETPNHFEAQAACDAAVETSGRLKTVAISLMKIAEDIRWLASGPRCGLGEINLPALQPGSSIMPGKVNPVIPEAVLQVGAQVIGNDATISVAGQRGNFELNTMLPVVAYNLLQSIEILSSVTRILSEKCIDGISANRDRCARNIEKSLAMATHLVPRIGYDAAAAVAKKAFETGRSVKKVALEMQIMAEKELDRIFSMENDNDEGGARE